MGWQARPDIGMYYVCVCVYMYMYMYMYMYIYIYIYLCVCVWLCMCNTKGPFSQLISLLIFQSFFF